jgi:hypothetical protein
VLHTYQLLPLLLLPLLLLLLLFAPSGSAEPEHAWGASGAAGNARHDAGSDGRCERHAYIHVLLLVHLYKHAQVQAIPASASKHKLCCISPTLASHAAILPVLHLQI